MNLMGEKNNQQQQQQGAWKNEMWRKTDKNKTKQQQKKSFTSIGA